MSLSSVRSLCAIVSVLSRLGAIGLTELYLTDSLRFGPSLESQYSTCWTRMWRVIVTMELHYPFGQSVPVPVTKIVEVVDLQTTSFGGKKCTELK